MSSEIRQAGAATVPAAAARSSRLRLLRIAAAAGTIAAVAAFVRYFDYSQPQFAVDGLWLVAIVLWVTLVKSVEPMPLFRLRRHGRDLVPLAFILPVFAAAWLPFYDDWRWAYTGDSFSVFSVGYWFGRNGLRQSLLSVHGFDNSFTYLWEISYNFPMRLFAPTLFWHRVGQLLWACLALTAIYTYFTTVIGRGWATAIVVATAINSVWLWFTYVSYLKIDSFVFYFLTLTLATVIWRQPDRLVPWMWCGVIAGLALFYTPTAWSAVILVGIALSVFALLTQRFAAAAVCGVSFVLVALPIIREIPWLLEMTARQTAPMLEWEYLERIFRQLILMPYTFEYNKLGVQGAFLRWPLGPMYLVGIALAALAAVVPLRRRLRLPAAAPALLALLLWDAVLLTLTNKGYGQPSTKRAYSLIPLQVFFALLPLIGVSAWAQTRRSQRVLLAVTIAALAVYGVANLRLIMFPAPLVYGTNVYDGMIEIRQRFPEQKVVLMTRRGVLQTSLSPDDLFHHAYGVADNLTLKSTFDAETIESACRQQALLCYEPNYDRAEMQPLLEQYDGRLLRFGLLNSFEIVCYECRLSNG